MSYYNNDYDVATIGYEAANADLAVKGPKLAVIHAQAVEKSGIFQSFRNLFARNSQKGSASIPPHHTIKSQRPYDEASIGIG